MPSRKRIRTTTTLLSFPVALTVALAFGAQADLPMTATFGLLLATPACLVVGDGGSGGGTVTLGTIGAPCSDSSTCSTGLFCYNSSTPPDSNLNGMCTADCSTTSATDTCAAASPGASCVPAADVCAFRCDGGQTCPAGTACNANDTYCEVSS